MEGLYKKLLQYAQSDYYGFHMPGHKRNTKALDFPNPYAIDITEIDGFDNLHHARGIIREGEHLAAELYGAGETKFLINGSTAGLLSAIAGTVQRGGCLLAARNCHKAVYHGIFLNDLEVQYLHPAYIRQYGISGGISAEQVEQQLTANNKIEAVIITSPTFDGYDSDVKAIAAVCHRHQVPLIVDQAHGAHYGLHKEFSEGAVKQGADIVIHSLHKTLPSMTQTALIHLNGGIIDKERVKKYLAIYQSSSPSYVLMSSIDSCVRLVNREGGHLFDEYVRILAQFRNKCTKLKHIQIAEDFDSSTDQVVSKDISKIIISVRGTSMTGKSLYNELLKKHHLQLEMAAGDYALAMTSVMDKEAGFERLYAALEEIDRDIYMVEQSEQIAGLPADIRKVLTISEAESSDKRTIRLEQSAGMITAEYVYLYPPGIPLLVPGEQITQELLDLFQYYKNCGLELDGLKDEAWINIVDKEHKNSGRCG